MSNSKTNTVPRDFRSSAFPWTTARTRSGPFAQQFHMNYPIVMGNAKIGEQYGGVLGLPIAFLLDRDGRITKKHIGATPAEVFDKEIATLLLKQ